MVRCFAFLHRFAHQKIFWPPAGQTLSSCSSSLYWHFLNISSIFKQRILDLLLLNQLFHKKNKEKKNLHHPLLKQQQQQQQQSTLVKGGLCQKKAALSVDTLTSLGQEFIWITSQSVLLILGKTTT